MPISKERLELYRNLDLSKSYIIEKERSELSVFLGVLFSIKRMLIIRVNEATHEKVTEEIKAFAESRQLDFTIIDAKGLTSDDIRGEREFVYIEHLPHFHRKKPFYWPQQDRSKVILVNGVNQNTDIEVLRAFLHVACLGIYDHQDSLPEEKLPHRSGFIFLADDDFPLERFASISDYWYEEARLFEEKDAY